MNLKKVSKTEFNDFLTSYLKNTRLTLNHFSGWLEFWDLNKSQIVARYLQEKPEEQWFEIENL